MKGTRKFYVGVSLVVLVIVLTAAQFMLQTKASAQGTQIGMYEVDRAWPKPLPNNWVLGSTTSIRTITSGSCTAARRRSIRSSAA
jgi:hypothetical protein